LNHPQTRIKHRLQLRGCNGHKSSQQGVGEFA
jgi:hypothetical protein